MYIVSGIGFTVLLIIFSFGNGYLSNVFFCNLSYLVSLKEGRHGFMVCFLCIFCIHICLMKENSVFGLRLPSKKDAYCN